MARAEERGKKQTRAERREHPVRAGRLLVIGGAEYPDEKKMRILPHLPFRTATASTCARRPHPPRRRGDPAGDGVL